MKKSNVISVRLNDKEIKALEIYAKIFNTDKTSTIIKNLLTINPHLKILKRIIESLDKKESKLTSLKLDFRDDTDLTNAIDKKIKSIDLLRTEILREIDTEFTCLRLAHSLIPKDDDCLNDCSDEQTNCYSDEEIDYGYDYDPDKEFEMVYGKSSNSNSSKIDTSDCIFDYDDTNYSELDGNELALKYEEDERFECKKMQERARMLLAQL